jgi:hypothetical protein
MKQSIKVKLTLLQFEALRSVNFAVLKGLEYRKEKAPDILIYYSELNSLKLAIDTGLHHLKASHEKERNLTFSYIQALCFYRVVTEVLLTSQLEKESLECVVCSSICRDIHQKFLS